MSDQAISRAQRVSVMLNAEIHRHDCPAATVHRVLNLSASGLGVSPVHGLNIGMIVAVTIGQVEHALAEVVRIADDRVGLRFNDPIDPAIARQRRVGAPLSVPTNGWLAEMQSMHRSRPIDRRRMR